ncbi:MAG: acetylxylan esterase [Bacteroidetes bacterium]|nr:acetylxylan esterase [Bacteroidota bacterium]MDA1122479.1 acetylxylan esterase [Bacteroidota bacterium]
MIKKMTENVFRVLLGFAAVLLLSDVSGQQLIIEPDIGSGIYKIGETVEWTIKRGEESFLDTVRYKLKDGGLIAIDSGELVLGHGPAQVQYTFGRPGTVLLDVRWGAEPSWRNKAVGGAVASPEKLVLSAIRPPDFDEFWELKLKELQSTPSNPVLEKGISEKPGIDYWKITMNNIRGSKIQGQLARPVGNQKLPAMLIVQWAGVYPLNKEWAINRAEKGWLVLNINPHDLPINMEEEFYKEQSQGNLKNYAAIGNDNRETSYFLRMYLSCYRAAQYLTERSDWNGETLVVMGDSQGGQQTLMTAGFHPAITAAMALVPAGFDMLGPEIGRKGGWPQWYSSVGDKDPQKVYEASRYFDVANFVTRIKCPILVGVGLLDETCPPEGILSAMNQVTAPKDIMIRDRCKILCFCDQLLIVKIFEVFL